MLFDTIQCDIQGKIAVLTIDRPPVNALNSDDYGELYEVLYALSKNEEVSVLILTASGEKVFVGGSDVREFAALNGHTGPMYTERNNSVRSYLYHYPKPVICAMNGSAYGGGIGLAICSDIRLCVDDAKFNLGEINMGIIGLTQHFVARCNNGVARKLIYTGEIIDAQQAREIGFVDEILPRQALMPRARQLAEKICAKSPIAIRYAKQCLIEAEKYALAGLGFEQECVCKLWATEDKTEAVTAFLEKRTPEFKNC